MALLIKMQKLDELIEKRFRKELLQGTISSRYVKWTTRLKRKK